MGNKYMLPALTGNVEPEAKTCWERREDAYDFLLSNLELEYESTESIFDGEQSVMPHLYEQMIAFTEAFFDEKSPEHERAKMEWKAILIIMALKKITHIRLQTLRVDLSGNSANPFLKAVSAFRPEKEPTIFETTWDFTYILLLNEEPIAIFSPLTVVCPAKMFKERIDPLQRWIWFEKINDRETLKLHFPGKANEYASIREWVRRMKAHLVPFRPDNPKILGRLQIMNSVINELINDVSHKTAQDIQFVLADKVYDGMNHTTRREYQFLNSCCDLKFMNKSLKFLSEKQEEDIFYDRLLLLKYDDRPDTLTDRNNFKRMHGLVSHIMKLDGRELISVTISSGEEVPFFVFLPLKQSFVKELTEKGIAPEDFFDEYKVIYIPERGTLEITLTIKEFSFSYRKEYALNECQMMESGLLNPVYIWPPKEIRKFDWQAYYVYMQENSQDIKLELPYRETEERVYSLIQPDGDSEKFHIIRTAMFPQYIYVTYNEVTGCLPIIPEMVECPDNGALATIYADVGNTSTYISMIKTIYNQNGNNSVERFPFQIPQALQVIKNPFRETSAGMNFMEKISEEPGKKAGAPETVENKIKHKYFQNVINDFSAYRICPDKYSVAPVQDGQVIFDRKGNQWNEMPVSFIGSRFSSMNQHYRKRMHIFLETILLYAEYEAVIHGCRYVQVKFLHNPDENNERLGELKGLWSDALRKTTARTGMTLTLEGETVVACGEQKALAYSIYTELAKRGSTSKGKMDEETLYIGADIGQTKTLFVNLRSDKNKIDVKYLTSQLSGRMLSFVDKEIPFCSYKNVLNVLLSGTYSMQEASLSISLLKRFAKLYDKSCKDAEYYYGLFDLIAMKIEREDFIISPDIYNRNQEFAHFIQMLTYNFMLLFLEIGIFAGKCLNNGEINPQRIDIYLSGNGAKFIRWIANLKRNREIDDSNCREMFIVSLNHTILDMVKIGIDLVCGSEFDKTICCTVRLTDESKEFLLEGVVGHDNPCINNFTSTIRDFSFSLMEGDVNVPDDKEINQMLNDLEKEIMENENAKGVKTNFSSKNNTCFVNELFEKIHSCSREVCKKGTAAIDQK